MDPLDLCTACWRASREGSHCPHCGHHLLFDVRVVPASSDRELQLKVASYLLEADVDVPLAQVRQAMATDGAVATRLDRDVARRLLQVLAARRLTARAEPSADEAVAPAQTSAAAVLGVVVAGLALGFLAVTVALRLATPRPRPALPAVAAAPVPTPAEEDRADSGAPAAAGPAAIFKRALPALATVSCPGRTGAGFFLGTERLLTNAHATCGRGADVSVKLDRGRQLLGKVRAVDDWLDFALVDVVGADVAEPLTPGDSTTLEPGQSVFVLGNPLGLEATLVEGKVSAVGRNLDGVAHIQLNAYLTGGNSGGPILDGSGRVLGIVTPGSHLAPGLGFGLPLEYAVPPGEAPARDRWEELLQKVRREDDEALRVMRARLERVLLANAERTAAGLLVSVLKLRATGPLQLDLEVREGARILCHAPGVVRDWVKLAAQLTGLSTDDPGYRQLRWLARKGLAPEVSGGVAQLSLAACAAPLPPGAVLVLAQDPQQYLPLPTSMAGQPGGGPEPELARDGREDEGWWRANFRNARREVERLESERERLVGTGPLRGEFTESVAGQARLPEVESALSTARAALRDLEESAAAKAIPLEWRR